MRSQQEKCGNYYNVVSQSFTVYPISIVEQVFLQIYNSAVSHLPASLYLYGVIGGGDLRMDAQLLYDGSSATLLDAHHQDIREPPAGFRRKKHISIADLYCRGSTLFRSTKLRKLLIDLKNRRVQMKDMKTRKLSFIFSFVHGGFLTVFGL